MMQFTSADGRTVLVDGVSTFYFDVGDGQPLVLIHGGGAGADSWSNWKDIVPAFGDGFRIIAVDMLGFGKTGKPDGDFIYSQGARNRHLAGFLRALDLTAPVVVGNSMGGCTALGVAVEHPELIGKLVLMGSAGLVTAVHEDLKPVVQYDFTRDGMVRLIRALTTDAFVIADSLVDYRFALATEPDTKRAYAATMGWVRDQNGLSYPEDFIRRNTVPTLVVNGKNDKVVPVANAYKFLELIQQSWGYILPNCGHWAMIEQPAAFARITRDFALS
jgi:2-hydroxy-6-oxo-6-(2'-aminophenyl)hexa-2,4-dienoate hydrolase